MMRFLFQIAIVAIVGAFLASCTTVGRQIETPSGQVTSIDGELVILRVVRKTSTTGNRPDARAGVVMQDIVMLCPEGTITAIPVLEQTAFGFGEIAPDDLSAVDERGVISITWDPNQCPFGMVHSGVHVTDVNAPAGGEQSVTLRTSAFLSDENSDDRWWHVSSYHVLCLGERSE
jgi:hypothetical protein